MQLLVRRGRSAGAWLAQSLAWWYVLVNALWSQCLAPATDWRRPQRGQAFIEYAILAGLLGVAVIVALTAFGPQLAGVFNRFGVRLGGMG